ncbi:unnamed protein product [Microthlaspi erraticum]|uniref:Uncharacterized protein n=1 Tax=Microthlaspi erraticum TaxID=1685480 RepID=A0A6D2J0A7_9BRAS|nr:unnamed protein product [Microthlaspi erraticum]
MGGSSKWDSPLLLSAIPLVTCSGGFLSTGVETWSRSVLNRGSRCRIWWIFGLVSRLFDLSSFFLSGGRCYPGLTSRSMTLLYRSDRDLLKGFFLGFRRTLLPKVWPWASSKIKKTKIYEFPRST